MLFAATIGVVLTKLGSWFTPVRIALIGTVLVAAMLLFPITFMAPGSHENTDCGSPLSFNPQNYNSPGVERHYWQAFVDSCTIRRGTRLAQTLGVLTLTGLLVTVSQARSRRRHD